MREVVVKLWCDKHWASDKSKVEATERVTLTLDHGQATDLDLCASHAAEARGTVKAWQKIGRPADAGPKHGGPSGPRSPERTEKLARLRDWAATTGRRNAAGGDAWKTPSGHGNYDRVEPKFDDWEAEHGQWDRARWLAGHPGDADAAVNGTAPIVV